MACPGCAQRRAAVASTVARVAVATKLILTPPAGAPRISAAVAAFAAKVAAVRARAR